MKKQEALHILGLQDGASDEDIKRAHRKLVVQNHPDKFTHDPALAAKAEEKTKRINEARDVLLSRRWEPDFGPTAAGWPYAGSANYRSPSSGSSPYSGSPFADFDLLEELLRQAQAGRSQGSQGTHFPGGFVYTVNFGGNSYTQSQQKSTSNRDNQNTYNPFGSADFGNPFGGNSNPFSAFFQNFYQEQLSPEERLDKELVSLKRQLHLFALKLVTFGFMAFFGALGPAVFLYALLSIVSYLRKERGVSLGLILLILVLFGPLFISLVPKGITPLSLSFLVIFAPALAYDMFTISKDMRAKFHSYAKLHKKSIKHFIQHLVYL